MRSRRGSFLLFMIVWTGMTLVPSGMALHGIVHQLRATLYPSVMGTITHSEVAEGRDSDGDPTYQFSVRYVYEVDGKPHEGTRYRYSMWGTSSRSFVERLVAQFPRQSTHPVHYRPAAPGDAVLVTGLQGIDLLVLLVMTPFLIATVAGWASLLRGRHVGEGVRSFVRNGRTHVTLRDSFPLVMGLLAAGGSAFMLAVVVAAGWGSDPPLQATLIAWVLVAAVGCGIAAQLRWRRMHGQYDLILDEASRQLVLPAGPGRSRPLAVNWSEIASVKCVRHTYEDDGGTRQVVWRPVLELTGAEGTRSEIVAEWPEKVRAELLAEWLSSHLDRWKNPATR